MKANAQTSTISGVINNYASVSTITAQSITVPSSSSFIVGDKVLLIQMKGATIDVTNTSSFGTINSYNDAGNYEMLIISAISSNTITFITPILRTYNVAGLVQLVKVPVYNNVNVTGVLTCLPWNGITGGVLVFEATGNVTLNANIDVIGKGFLGGAKVAGQFLSCTGNSTDFKLPSTSLLSGNKGEGIALINTSYAKGLGALANGGGAGNDVNGGGAGGGNFGMGGHGGNCKCSTSPIALCGGYEGKNCVYSNSINKIFLGGGGGSGHENDGVSTAGVSGGGIVIIRSGGTISGNGNFINANGNDNNMIAGNDGQGGGGAGGTVLLDVCSTSSLNISVKGGKGGTDNFTGPDCHGKGGGGGGGVIWTSSAFPYTSFLTGGNPGVFTNSASQCFNTSNGATAGQIGGTLSGLLIPGATSLSSVNGFTINTSSVCSGSSNGTAIATLSTSVFSPTVSFTLINSVGTVVSQTSNTSSLTNSVTNLPNGIYTFSVQMNTSCGLISNTQTVNISCTTSSVPPCKGVLTGTGMSVCNQYSFSITPSQTITPFNYGSQGYACTATSMPDVSFNIMGAGWRVMKNNWFFESSVAGEITGFDNIGVLQTIPFSATNTITPLSYSGSFVQFAINGVAIGALLNQTTFSISLNSSLHTPNNYTYCPTSSSISISPIVPSQGGPWTYTWQPGNLSGNPISVSPSANTIYTVTANSIAGCLSTATVGVNINCTPPPLCSGTTGAPIFFEDFGSGSLYGPALPPGVTNYIYQTGVPGNGTYVIANSSNPSGTNAGYVNASDHTGNPNGYMMVVNSDYAAAEVYRKHVTGLCQNTTYVFSAYLANNNSPDAVSNVCGSSYVYANIKFQVEFPIATIQNSVTSGNLAVASNSTTLPWIQYGFAFTTGAGQTSADVVLINNAPGGCGNDYVVDDISLAPCGPGVSLTIVPNQTVFCVGDVVNLQSNYTSGNYVNPQYQWQFSNDGGITWSNISGATSQNYNISSVSLAQSGMYHLLVAENGNISSPACSIIAGPLTFSVSSGISVVSSSMICAGTSITLSASGVTSYSWNTNATTSTIVVSPTSTTSYTVVGTIGTCTSQAIATVTVLPSAAISVTGNTLICEGQSTSLTASGASSYSWNPGGSAQSITITPNATTNYSVIASGSVCANTVVATVSVVPNPTLTLSPNTSICTGANNSVTLTASGASTYTWVNASSLSASTGSVVTASPNTTTNYTVTGANNLCTNTAIVTVSVNPSPSITSTLVTNTSCGLSNGSATVTSLPANNTYTWSSGILSTTNTVSSLAAGSYTVTAINGACQTSTVINILGSSLLQIVSNTVSPANCGVNNGQIIVTDNYTNSTYSWSPVTSTTNTLTNLATGNYSVLITNGACSTSSVFTVSQLSGPTSLNVNQHNAICESSNGSLTITSVINGASPYQYAFNNSGYSSVSTHSNLSQGVYTITVKDVYGCIYSQDYIITKVIEHSQIEFIANRPSCNSNDGSFIVNSINGGTTPYLLNFNNTLYSSNTTFEQIEIGDYSLTILDSNLCESSFVLSMPLDKSDYTLYVPNTFTPNNDTRNDFWFAKATCLNAFNCLIFNRWGEKIIELKDINEFWDGTYKGKPVPEGVYVYLIEAETNDGTIYKNGHITLFR